ncbi:MAG: hypothetical protein KME47_09660 [Nodosilinea sp. WJT8-NPBG4]|jgi:hypothetical protein|nr:hypothetical protein [Nodosilinea sp. WJT8-NPBG4]
MTLSGLTLARDGIGYGGLVTASDGFNTSNKLKTSNLTISPPNLVSYSSITNFNSIQIGFNELSSIDLSLTVDYFEYLLALDSISYDLIMSSTISAPSLGSYDSPVTLDFIAKEPELGSVSFGIVVDSIDYVITLNSIELKPSGTFGD